jgi:hypothetical protein
VVAAQQRRGRKFSHADKIKLFIITSVRELNLRSFTNKESAR